MCVDRSKCFDRTLKRLDYSFAGELMISKSPSLTKI